MIRPQVSFVFLSFTLLLVSSFSSTSTLAMAAPSYSIELEEFRWNSFPLKVLVDLNQWSRPEYAVAVQGALDAWMLSIWNYVDLFGGTALSDIQYELYLSNVNFTSNYDVLVSFTGDEIYQSAIGLTSYEWNVATHEPIPPITINITTYSKSASSAFVKDVVMHEFGHALGLGHASPQNTSNGPELMYARASKTGITYPSTLDIYGLTMLYQGNYNQAVQLPSSIPYMMLADGSVPPPAEKPLWEQCFVYLIALAAVLSVVALGLAFWKMSRKSKSEEPSREADRKLETGNLQGENLSFTRLNP